MNRPVCPTPLSFECHSVLSQLRIVSLIYFRCAAYMLNRLLLNVYLTKGTLFCFSSLCLRVFISTMLLLLLFLFLLLLLLGFLGFDNRGITPITSDCKVFSNVWQSQRSQHRSQMQGLESKNLLSTNFHVRLIIRDFRPIGLLKRIFFVYSVNESASPVDKFSKSLFFLALV